MARGPRQEGLSRRHRFTAQGAFGPALRGPHKIKGESLLIHAVAGMAGISRIGIALTRRVAPSSVDRNRLKRLVREVFRRHPAKHLGLDLVVAFRERGARRSAEALRREVQGLFDQAVSGTGL